MLITIAIKSPRMNVINWCRYWTDLEDYSNVSNVAAFMKFNVMIVLYYKISYLSNFLYFSFFIYTIFKSSIIIVASKMQIKNLSLIFTIGTLEDLIFPNKNSCFILHFKTKMQVCSTVTRRSRV